MKDSPFIAAARAGENDFWRYGFSYLLVIFLMQTGRSIILEVLVAITGIGAADLASSMPGPLILAVNLVSFAFIPLGLFFCMRLLHRRPLMSLINPTRRFDWARFGLGAGLWLAICILYNLVFAVLKPGYYAWSLDLPAFLPYLLVGLLLIPVQAGAEELFYRGYLTQGLGLVSWWLAWLAPAILFGLAHAFNPEVGLFGMLQTLPVYIGMGVLFGWITLRSGSLEMALGVHILNNLYMTLVTSAPSSVLKAQSIFTIQAYDALAELIAFFVALTAFIIMFEWLLYRAPRAGNLPCLSILPAVVAAGLLLSLAACSPATPAPQSEPALSLSDCRLSMGPFRSGIEAECGTLSVPENRGEPEGRQIELNVAVVRAVSRNAEPDPLFLLAGGPGEAATEAFVPMLGSLEQVRMKRDLVLVDQRGTGKSGALDCQPDEPTPTPDPAMTATPIGLEAPRGDQLEEVRSCLEQMPEADLTQYTTEIAMQDLDDVRAALGYEQINLLGVSYGTRAALTYARLFPERVRTMTLDGVVPPGWALGNSMRADAQQALNFIFERCMAIATCSQAFPDFENDFYDVLERSQQQAIEVETVHPTTGKKVRIAITPLVVTSTVRIMSYSDAQVALLPLMLNSAYQGDYSLLASQYLLVMDALSGSMSTGMYFSVWCYEDLPRLAPEGELGSYYFDPDMSLSREICELWPKPGDEPRPTRTPTAAGTPDGAATPGAGTPTAATPGAAGSPTAPVTPGSGSPTPDGYPGAADPGAWIGGAGIDMVAFHPAQAATGYPVQDTPAPADTPGAYPAPGAQATEGVESPTAAPTTPGGSPVPTTTVDAASPTATGTIIATGIPGAAIPGAATPDIDWERSFPRTDIPVMLISGEADPVTPPRNGDDVAALFTNSVHIVLPGMGHGNFFLGCMPTLLRDFLDAASPLALNLDCTRTIQPAPFFLSPVGPQPGHQP